MVGGDTAMGRGKCWQVGMLFEDFKLRVFDSYIEGLGFDKRFLVTLVGRLRI